jgi:hypothetical protein
MPNLVTCPCQNCNGHIQFDAATLSKENNKIPCPHCGLETMLFVPPPRAAMKHAIPSPLHPLRTPVLPAKLKNHWPFIIIVGFILFFGYRYYHGVQETNHFLDSIDDPRSREEAGPRTARLRAAAPDALKKACLETVTGFTRIIDPCLSDYDDNPDKWTADATLEFVNTRGGVERTNLAFVFVVLSGELYCHPDIIKNSDRDYAKWKAGIDRLMKTN